MSSLFAVGLRHWGGREGRYSHSRYRTTTDSQRRPRPTTQARTTSAGWTGARQTEGAARPAGDEWSEINCGRQPAQSPQRGGGSRYWLALEAGALRVQRHLCSRQGWRRPGESERHSAHLVTFQRGVDKGGLVVNGVSPGWETLASGPDSLSPSLSPLPPPPPHLSLSYCCQCSSIDGLVTGSKRTQTIILGK